MNSALQAGRPASLHGDGAGQDAGDDDGAHQRQRKMSATVHLALLWGEGEGGATGPSRANHAPAAGAAGLDPGYFAHAQDDARARDGPSMPRFALSLMRPIIIASIWAFTVAMQ